MHRQNPSGVPLHGEFFSRGKRLILSPLIITETSDSHGEKTRSERIAKNGGSWREEQFLYKDNKISGVFEVNAFQAAPGRMIAMFSDVTARLRAQEEIQLKNVELMRSNRDLEAFAFAASHDMQEPIRMVSSFVQLLAERYHDKLDADAEIYLQ